MSSEVTTCYAKYSSSQYEPLGMQGGFDKHLSRYNDFKIEYTKRDLSEKKGYNNHPFTVLASATSDNKEELMDRFENSLKKMTVLKKHHLEVINYEFLGCKTVLLTKY
ncbi:MAG: hypothetical protein QF441_03670 [Bacteriovoracaceae bacterium]|jgi:hypothetical protein|nr:hypothetical protein [Bacteriovoracaceae bacterium]